MSFGFSVGDFIAVGKTAWRVYKSCKGAGGAFEEVSYEVVALRTVLLELEDEVDNPESVFNRAGAAKKQELGRLAKQCDSVLQSLNQLLITYSSLGTKSKRTWDRLRFGAGNLQEIRDQLMVHKSSLTLYLTTLNTGSLGRIEQKLDELIADVRSGRRADSVLTIADDDGSDIQWNLLKRELAEEGFSKVELEGHKHWIKATLFERIKNGELEEQPPNLLGSQEVTKGEFSSPYTQPRLQSPPSENYRLASAAKYSQYLGKSFDVSEEAYDSDNSCLPTDSASQVNVLVVNPRSVASPSAFEDDSASGLPPKERNGMHGSSQALGSAHLEKRPSEPQANGNQDYYWSAKRSFDQPLVYSPQKYRPKRQGTSEGLIPAEGPIYSPLKQSERLSTAGDVLWPLPLELSLRPNAANTTASMTSGLLDQGAVTEPQLPSAFPHRDPNLSPETIPSHSLSPRSQRSQSYGSSELPSPNTSPDPLDHAVQRLSVNTNGDLESTSTSTNRFSHLSSGSRTTISSSSSTTLPIFPAGSTANRAKANHAFIKAASTGKKDDIKKLSSWSTLPHVRSLLAPDTINTALLELSMNPKNEKRRVDAIKNILAGCEPYLDCRDVKHARTPLIWAVLNGHESTMELLLAKNSSLHSRDGKFLRTPLAWASANGAWRATEILLAKDSTHMHVNAKDKQGRTALDLAEAGKFMKTAQILLRHSAQSGINSNSPLPLLVELP